MKIEWTEPAATDLQHIKEYIGADSKYYASQFIAKIIEAAESLRKFPLRGRLVPEAESKTIRELLFYNYRIIYQVEPARILILTIIHGNRDLQRKSIKPWDIT